MNTNRTSDRLRPGKFAGLAGVILGLSLISSCSRQEIAVTLFEDVTAKSNLGTYTGMTHGIAWGDFDGDGLPDIYVTNHLRDPLLFRNLGKGQFADVTSAFFAADELKGDKHGAVWADFDNDGRTDLAQLTGAIKGLGEEPKRLFHNMGDHFTDVAVALGVQNPEGRTRMPLWVDLDRDGRLDLFHGAEARFDDKTPPFVYLQQNDRFVPSNVLPLGARSVPFCTITQLTGDGHPELLCRVIGKTRTAQVFDLASLPARDLELLPVTAFEDVATADFDNDGHMDLYLARKTEPGPVAFGQRGEKEIVADVWIDKNDVDKPMGFTFRSEGTLSLRVLAANPADVIAPARIHLGQQDARPSALAFDVSPATTGISGLAPHAPGKETGVYLGFSAPDRWELHVTAPRDAITAGKPKYQQIQVKIASTTPITKLEAIGDVTTPEEAPARLFMNRDGKLVEESEKRGVNKRLVAGTNVVAGDFDNDMDVDIFVLASGDIGQQENLLLLNQGDGKFDVARGAGGATGSRTGVGDSVTMADFDSDGFLDLLMSNGGSMGRSLGLPSEAGGYRLYRNVSNGNHWIEIDLEGTKSNRDGIGARIQLTAGSASQVRLQDNGVHERGQNHSRIHFGLGKNAIADKIKVQWPSGKIQELNNITANQIIRIKETE